MNTVAVTVLPTPPTLDNKAYLVMDYDTGQILGASNSDLELPPASLTKMMTSFIIEQQLLSGKLKETDMVTMPESAWCRGRSSESCMYVPLNGKASVIDMLRGIIIQSGNDASKAMAIHIGGTEAGFVDMMNEQAKKLGMTHTHFVNASGLPAEGHYSSARDMAVLGRAIVHGSSKYFPIYAEKEFTFNNISQDNRNLLLKTDSTVDGFKTGHTKEAGYCLVATSMRNNMRLITVVMGAKSMPVRAQQSRELLSWGFTNYKHKILVDQGIKLASPHVWFGQTKTVDVGLNHPLTALMTRNEDSVIETKLQMTPELGAPIKKGQVVGKAQAIMDGKVIATEDVVALNDIEESGFISRLLDHVSMFFGRLMD